MIKYYRPTIAEIDIGAIRHNLGQVKKIVAEDVSILGVVKADAYGHGMREVSLELVRNGVSYLGVASIDEARELRNIGIKKDIIVLGAVLPEDIEGVLRFNVIQTISGLSIAKLLSRQAKKKNKKAKVHIKIDTGMGRLGLWHKEALAIIKKIYLLDNIVVDGIFTHFPSAEDDIAFTKKQIDSFNSLIKELESCGIYIPFRHTSNSMALVNFKESHMNMVRPGLIMYGLYPKDGLRNILKLRQALTLKTKIVCLKEVEKGRSISYGRTHITKRPTKIATLPIGYGDGYSRHLSNKGEVLIRGKRSPIVGRVCMDMIMCDVGHIKGVKVGDEVVLIGRQGKDIIRAEDLAHLSRTISYEVVCNIGRRVPRVYKN
ncbi:MAG: alanine racemase [Candidatus Omnitrophota bacterium]